MVVVAALIAVAAPVLLLAAWGRIPAGLAQMLPSSSTDRALIARQRVEPALREALDRQQLRWGAPVLLRVFKQQSELELWVQADDGRFQLFRTWPVCRWSGSLGPKLQEGDGQAPEGFYAVTAAAMNPRSRFHLSFNLGFPNAFDRHHGRTGSFLMVHGDCVSIGCYAMGDAAIEEIYTLVAAAHDGGQANVPVHALPFRFDDGWQARHAGSPWLDFWQQLADIDTAFSRDRVLRPIVTTQGRYQLVPR